MAERVSSHIDLFRSLRPYLRRDLTVTVGFPNPVAGQILNWFDPAHPEYLARVDAWQKLLCTGATAQTIPFLSEYEDCGIVRDNALSVVEAKAIQQIAKLLYKYHGEPAKKTDWGEVQMRLAKPLPLRLKDSEIQGIRQCLSSIGPVDLNACCGRFGPGATAEGFTAWQKWMRLGEIPDVPPSLYRANPRDDWVPARTNPFRYTKMAEVPKSIKSNRTVSSEPAMSMFAQLAVADQLIRQMHLAFPGHVSLSDQSKHNKLLLRDGMATLDLSDASDHVQCDLVECVLPQLWPVLAKVRSEFTQTPCGLIKLATFAPMGSGVCFPIMTLVIIGIIAFAFRSLGFRWLSEPWSVYGDDVIVPLYITDYVQDLLERAGLVLNHSKCCTAVSYLESCGLEVYHKIDITPAYIRDPLDTLDAAKVEQIAQRMGEQYPSTTEEIVRKARAIKGARWNDELQRQEVLVRTTSARPKLAILDGYAGLNRWFSVGTLQDGYWRNHDWLAKLPGVACEVWTKPAWRYKPSSNYPNLTHWLVTSVRKHA